MPEWDVRFKPEYTIPLGRPAINMTGSLLEKNLIEIPQADKNCHIEL